MLGMQTRQLRAENHRDTGNGVHVMKCWWQSKEGACVELDTEQISEHRRCPQQTGVISPNK